MSTTMDHRPITSKARGICKYYTTDRGCYAGRFCKFLHSTESPLDPSGSRPPILTPFDQSKRCRYFANGYCKRGEKCWFTHLVGPKQAEADEAEPCCICLEKPLTYGLLVGCSHIFCIDCIRRWRDPLKNVDGNTSNLKKCPMCRIRSSYTIPSSRFWRDGEEGKAKAIEKYKTSMSNVDCKYFAGSILHNPQNPICPFGKDCFYRHLNADGIPHVLKNGIETSMHTWRRRRNHSLSSFDTDGDQDTYSNIINFLDRVVAEFVDATSPEVSGRDSRGGSQSHSRTRNSETTSSPVRDYNSWLAGGDTAIAQNDQQRSASSRTVGSGISALSTWWLDTSREAADNEWGWNVDSISDASSDTHSTSTGMNQSTDTNRETADGQDWNDESVTDTNQGDDFWPTSMNWGLDASETVDNGWGWNDLPSDTRHDADPHIMGQLELLADHMLGSLRYIRGHDTELSPPPLEPAGLPRPLEHGESVINASNLPGNDNSGMPTLERASGLTPSEVSHAEEATSGPDEDQGVGEPMLGAETVMDDRRGSHSPAEGPREISPFVTDGRGRVVWSNKAAAPP